MTTERKPQRKGRRKPATFETEEAEIVRALGSILTGFRSFAVIIAERLAAGSPQAVQAGAQLRSFVDQRLEPALRALEALAGEHPPEREA